MLSNQHPAISNRYRPISDYALIGNRHTCALVARDGSIDWLCLPHLDSRSLFAAILDNSRGGRWRLAPVDDDFRVERSYMGPSAVLETIFRCPTGVLRLRDFLPIRRGRRGEFSRSAHSVVRKAECIEGEVTVGMEWTPRPNYARADVRLVLDDDTIHAISDAGEFWLTGLPESAGVLLSGASASMEVHLRNGERLDLVCGWGDSRPARPAEAAAQQLDEALEWWTGWADACNLEEGVERWRDLVIRSGMVLKLLTNERSGGIAAAPTTSLPEEIGGVRNWDYRFCWVRDASMISQAFATIGHPTDGVAFLNFLERAAAQHRDPARIQVLYGLSGETPEAEYNLGHLDGYADSRPVRVGNAAAQQTQLDVYGELLEAAYDLVLLNAPITDSQWTWLRGVVDYVCQVWRYPDQGIWEVRGPAQHFTYSKVMCWVALDRAIRLAELLNWEGPTDVWERERAEIHALVLEHGFSAERNSFVQAFDSTTLDASSLLIPAVGFLPPDDPRVQATIDATLRELTEDGLVHRYRTGETSDGVGGGEGAFGICTFWLSNALAMSGRVDEAEKIFESMAARANDVGLFPEEIDPQTGLFLGNFPQAFTHVGLINAARHLGRARS